MQNVWKCVFSFINREEIENTFINPWDVFTMNQHLPRFSKTCTTFAQILFKDPTITTSKMDLNA